jgi:beta-ribofuranosylaminobenzene 5'-phosphate synthase
MPKIIIKLPFRIHMNLHAMHECVYRKNGGIGFCVSTTCTLYAKKSIDMKISVDGICKDHSKVSFIETRLNAIKREYSLKSSVNIDIKGNLLFHCGLGVGTALTLAAIESLFIVNDKKISDEKIQELSGRGGTSGIGLYTYFEGGFILDAGVSQDGNKHIPSSYNTLNKLPLKLLRVDLPSWNCIFVIPKGENQTFGIEEKSFFEKNTPINSASAFEASYLSLMGVIPSLLESDYEKFKKSVFKIQDTVWKKLEICNSTEEVTKLIERGKNSNIACGMSSIGSGVYFISDESITNFSDELKDDGFDVYDLELSNTGRDVSYV